MPKNERALPDGFMTVGKLAERMGVTVRTLQYYDREGLLSPTAESGGGRRLYTDKDMIQLHQILSLKSLGFSLDDIKNRLAPLDTPADVADALAAQAAAVREKIAVLTESLTAIETLRAEVLQMQTVDFKKYADIIVNLQMKNEFYWLIKHFDERTLDHIRSRFDKESGRAMLETFNRLQDEALRLLAHKAHGKQGGARDLRRLIRKEVEDKICSLLVDRYQNQPAGISIGAEDDKVVLHVLD